MINEDKLRVEVLDKIFTEINKHVKEGDLPGNGLDQTAERNGLILALNIITREYGKIIPNIYKHERALAHD